VQALARLADVEGDQEVLPRPGPGHRAYARGDGGVGAAAAAAAAADPAEETAFRWRLGVCVEMARDVAAREQAYGEAADQGLEGQAAQLLGSGIAMQDAAGAGLDQEDRRGQQVIQVPGQWRGVRAGTAWLGSLGPGAGHGRDRGRSQDVIYITPKPGPSGGSSVEAPVGPRVVRDVREQGAVMPADAHPRVPGGLRGAGQDGSVGRRRDDGVASLPRAQWAQRLQCTAEFVQMLPLLPLLQAHGLPQAPAGQFELPPPLADVPVRTQGAQSGAATVQTAAPLHQGM